MSKCYYYIAENMNWSEAKVMCAALDPDRAATLTSVRSKKENDFVESLMISNSWIGGTDEVDEGTWR